MLFLCFSLAMAITPVYEIDTQHPYVGLAWFSDVNDERLHFCSGTLIDSTTFVTAAHCLTEEAVQARVWFHTFLAANYNQLLGYDTVTGFPVFCGTALCSTSTIFANYGFTNFVDYPREPNARDLAVLKLQSPVQLPVYGFVSTSPTLDLPPGQESADFVSSGYGLSTAPNPRSPLPSLAFFTRLMANSSFVNANSALNDGYYLQLNGNGDARGGTCFGDSGGPVLQHSSDRVLAVTSFGLNPSCRGTDFAYRVDQNEAVTWIESLV